MSDTRFINAYAPSRFTAADLGIAWRARDAADYSAWMERRHRIGVWHVHPRCPVLAALCGPWGRAAERVG